MEWIRGGAAMAVLLLGCSLSTWATSTGPRRPAEVYSASYVPSMIRALHDDDCTVRRAAARALGRIGPAAREALPYLCCAAGDPEESVRRAVDDAVRRIDPEAAKCLRAVP